MCARGRGVCVPINHSGPAARARALATQRWCEGEWQLFLRHATTTFADRAAGGAETAAYAFRLIVVYDVGEKNADATVADVHATLDKMRITPELRESATLVRAVVDGEASRVSPDERARFIAACRSADAELEAVIEGDGLTPDATLRAAEILYERDWSMLARDVLEDQMWWTPDSLRGLTKRLLTDLDLPSTLSVRARVSCVF